MSEENFTIYKKYKIFINRDEDIENPRNFMDFGKMVCFHKRYNLGDKHSIRYQDYEKWEGISDFLEKEESAVIVLPLFLYDHSGVSISTSNFSCPWDSGQVGFIYTTRAEILSTFGRKNLTKNLISLAISSLENEVKVYNSYLSGDGCSYTIEDEAGEIVDDCCGFYSEKDARVSAQEFVDALVKGKV